MENEIKEIRPQRITNPLYINQIAPAIQGFVEKINLPNLTYETVVAYITSSVQFGGDMTEFWVVYEENEPHPTPIAFAHWKIKGAPFIGTAYGEYIYSWNRRRDPVELLVDKFIDFGKRHRCSWYAADVLNPAIFRVFRKAFHKKGIEIKSTDAVYFLGR